MNRRVRLSQIIFATVSLIAVIALLSFSFICNQKYYDLITERVIDDYEETIVAVKKNVETLISYTEDFSKYVALDLRIHDLMRERNEGSEPKTAYNDAETQEKWAKIRSGLIYSTSRLAGFGVYAEDELLYSFFNSTVPYDTDIISLSELERAKQRKNPVWTGLLTLEVTSGWYHKKEHVFSVLKYMQGEQGDHIGTLALFVRETSFSDILTNADDSQNRSFYLVDSEGKIISSENKEHLYQDAAEVLGLSDSQIRSCFSDGSLLIESKEEVPILYVTSEIQGVPFRLVGRTVWAVENGITSGVSATRFGPDAPCTRAQVVTFLWRAAGSPIAANRENPFSDVSSNDYYYEAVLWAVEKGITTGTSATTFSSDAPCTRAQIVTFLWRAEGKLAAGAGSSFVDVGEEDYYAVAVQWAVENDITTGTSAATFSPDAVCARAQTVTFLFRAKD